MGMLDGKVAFITGAARGQGRAHAVKMAAEGADVIAIDICADIATAPYALSTPEDLEETVQQVKALNRRIVARTVDTRDNASVRAAVHDGVSELGRLDIVVANAGIAPLVLDPADPVQSWQDVIDTNLTGTFNTVEAALPTIVAGQEGGSVIIISSTAGIKGSLAMKTVGGYAYTASKHAIVGLMRGYANDYAKHSIRVNTVHPTGVDTPMVNNEAMANLMANRDVSAWVNLLPVGRMTPADMSNAVAWLASDQARYITGAVIPVDAGFTSK
jgi:SDR family mycofactocin-dependent oxidoreductase